jgi:DNA uptake protein ComE-like DNA-binding protein
MPAKRSPSQLSSVPLPDWWAALRLRLHPARSRLQQDPYARMNSWEEVAIAADLGIQIDVNRATVDDWLRLPGLSIHQARALTQLTQQGIHFHGVEDLAAALGLSVNALIPLLPVLQFCYYDPQSPILPPATSLNQAEPSELLQVPGMSPAIVQAILQGRQQRPYASLADLQQRLRLSPTLIAQWLHYLRP